MREQQKNIKSTDTLQYFGNFKFKMEVQGIQETSFQQNSQNNLDSFQASKDLLPSQEFNFQILDLISKGLPVFVFQAKSQKETQIKDNSINQDKTSFLSERILTYNRKAKSLEQLSKKFIQHFEGRGNNLIELDKITLQLGVQRRRIYDVINILQSLSVVSKKGKNNYEWKGLCQAVRTINDCFKEGPNYKIQIFKKEKSLEYLASGFLKLFITWKPAISLQQAAKQMMKQIDDASVKTKIRRLYDIINVFRSLGLVRKTSLPSKKPGYQWAGTQYLQHIIMRKQYSDENTGLNELNNEEQVQNPEQKLSSFLYLKESIFSPMICPLLQKSKQDKFKLLIETRHQSKQEQGKFEDKKFIREQLAQQNFEFPIFRRTGSAFTLVAPVKKNQQ